MSSPFDEDAVDFLLSLGVDALKIASFELNHIPLIQKCAATNIPIIISTGVSDFTEIKEAVDIFKNNNSKLILLHCISSYPALASSFNLNKITELKNNFNTLVGLSDHCINNHISFSSIPLGVCLIEKHFTLNRSDNGLDDSFSLEPHELNELSTFSRDIKLSLLSDCDGGKSNSIYKRSIYCSSHIKKGELFTTKNIRVIRPSYGLHPRYYQKLIGKKSNRDINFGEKLTENDLF